MKYLSDRGLDRLRDGVDAPDLTGTRYRLLGKLGQGGMGGVYRVEDSALGRQVALKVLNSIDAGSEIAARLIREAKVIAQLEHPGIVPVHDVGTLPDGRVFYTMKLVQGKRLDEFAGESSSLPDRLRLFQKICDAVSFAHAHGVLHRDLKPENIMVGPFGEVLVMDWGLSKALERTEPSPCQPARSELPVSEPGSARQGGPTAHGTVLGTPGYMAPEQARGDISLLDERADVFALGAILKFLLNPYPSAAGGSEITPGPSTRDNQAGRPDEGRHPKALRAICRKAMSAEPYLRYSTATELGRDIASYLDGLPVSAYPEGALTRAWRWIWRNRIWVVLILAYLVMRAVLLWWQRP
jgi:serine/threonine protein kinase